MTSSSQWPVCCESAGRPTGWLVNPGLFSSFSHEISQKVLRHYIQNVMNIVVCANTHNWMANNASMEPYIWYNCETVPWNRSNCSKWAEWLNVWWQRYKSCSNSRRPGRCAGDCQNVWSSPWSPQWDLQNLAPILWSQPEWLCLIKSFQLLDFHSKSTRSIFM